VHRGFQDAYLLVREAVHAWVRDGSTLWMTGHSLGGALATLAAFDLHVTRDIKVFLVTWGCPRVGNASFTSLFRSAGRADRVARFITAGDPIPTIPPRIAGFSHVCAAIKIGPPDAAPAGDEPPPPPPPPEAEAGAGAGAGASTSRASRILSTVTPVAKSAAATAATTAAATARAAAATASHAAGMPLRTKAAHSMKNYLELLSLHTEHVDVPLWDARMPVFDAFPRVLGEVTRRTASGSLPGRSTRKLVVDFRGTEYSVIFFSGGKVDGMEPHERGEALLELLRSGLSEASLSSFLSDWALASAP